MAKLRAYFFDWMDTLGHYKDMINFKEHLTLEEYSSFYVTKTLDELTNLTGERKEKVLWGLNNTLLGIFEDSLDVLKKLKEENYKLCLISNTYPITPSRCRESFEEILSYFDVITFSSEIGIKKPDESIFKFTLDKLNELSEEKILPEEIIMIGDNEKYDFIPAIKFGMQARLIDRNKQSLVEVI